MWDCEPAIRGLIAAVEPSAPQKAAASRSHNHLRDLLGSGRFGDRILDSYLSGSYARETAIAPIDDVDIVFLVDPHGWQSNWLSATPTPDAILKSFASAIRYRYADSSVHVQRRSVCLALRHLSIDVVPAIPDSKDAAIIAIPDVESAGWIRSAPKKHIEIAGQINGSCSGRYKPVVKLLKHWNSSLPQTAKLKSFAIETMAATLFRHVGLPTFQEGLRSFFDFVAALDGKARLHKWTSHYGISLSWWATEIPDLARTGSNLAANLDVSRRIKFLEHAVRSRDTLIQAENARTLRSAESHIRTALRM